MIAHNLNTLQKFNCPLVRTETKSIHLKEEFEDTKEAIIIRISKKTDNTMAKNKGTKGQTTIDKAYTYN